MNDLGRDGDELAGDGIYSATLISIKAIIQSTILRKSYRNSHHSPGPAPELPALWVVDNSNIPTDLRTHGLLSQSMIAFIKQYRWRIISGL